MNAETTSLAPANSTRGEWGQYARFLKRPALPDRAPMPRLSSLGAVFRLFALDLVLMSALLAIAGAVMATGVDVPETALAGMEIGGGILFAVVVVAPLAEEIIFRGWLSGRPGHILGLIAAVPVTIAAAAAFSLAGGQSLGQIWLGALVAVLAGLATALGIVFWLRRHTAMGWFQRFFPLFFWLSTLAFSLVHVFNFEPEQMIMALPLVLPQFVTGTMLGYLRVNYGLWSSILLHMLHNGAFISLVLLAGSAGA